MSTDLKEIESEVNSTVFVSQHSGGTERGLLFQVSQKQVDNWKYEAVNMTRNQAIDLRNELNKWLES